MRQLLILFSLFLIYACTFNTKTIDKDWKIIGKNGVSNYPRQAEQLFFTKTDNQPRIYTTNNSKIPVKFFSHTTDRKWEKKYSDFNVPNINVLKAFISYKDIPYIIYSVGNNTLGIYQFVKSKWEILTVDNNFPFTNAGELVDIKQDLKGVFYLVFLKRNHGLTIIKVEDNHLTTLPQSYECTYNVYNIAIDPNGILYLATLETNKYTQVYKYDNNIWSKTVGLNDARFWTRKVKSIFFDQQNVPYIFYFGTQDCGSGQQTGGIILKYSSKDRNWICSDYSIITDNIGESVYLTFLDNTPCIAFLEPGATSGQKDLSVKKYNNSTYTWEYVGKKTFSEIKTGEIIPFYFYKDFSNDLYISYFVWYQLTPGLSESYALKYFK